VDGDSMNWTDRDLELIEQALVTEIDKRENMHKAKDRLCVYSLKRVYAKVYTVLQRRKDGRKTY
jgi:hypothetical protein